MSHGTQWGHPMWMDQATWDDVRAFSESENEGLYPHIVMPEPGEVDALNLMSPTELTPQIKLVPPIEIVEPPGLTRLEVLRPVWEWRGDPPVLHVVTVGWRAWEDMQIALELERQILGTSMYIEWAEPRITKSPDLDLEVDYAYLEMQMVVALGLASPIAEIKEPSRVSHLLTPSFALKKDKESE